MSVSLGKGWYLRRMCVLDYSTESSGSFQINFHLYIKSWSVISSFLLVSNEVQDLKCCL